MRYTLEITHRCNLRCNFCYVSDRQNSKHWADGSAADNASLRCQELDTSQWLDIIAQIPRWSFISFEGGEVFVRPDFLRLLRAASKRVWGKVNLITNGTLLNDEAIAELLSIRPLVVSVSLDGLEATHDRFRGAGSFAKTLSALRKLSTRRKSGYPLIDVKTVVLPENLAQLPELYELCGELKANFFSLSWRCDNHFKQSACLQDSLPVQWCHGSFPAESYLDMSAFDEVLRQLRQKHSQLNVEVRWAPKFASAFSERQFRSFWQAGKRPPAEIYEPCLYPFSNVIIAPSGHMYPCLAVDMGSVVGKKLSSVYNNHRFRAFRGCLRSQGLLPACQLCCEAKVRRVPKHK